MFTVLSRCWEFVTLSRHLILQGASIALDIIWPVIYDTPRPVMKFIFQVAQSQRFRLIKLTIMKFASLYMLWEMGRNESFFIVACAANPNFDFREPAASMPSLAR